MDLDNKNIELKNEELIWIVYVGIIIFSFLSNYYEKKYLLNNGDTRSKIIYRRIMILIFSILLLVYLYFLKDSIESIKSLRKGDSNRKKQLTYLSFVASLLIAISGFIYLYIAYSDENLDVEIAFNWFIYLLCFLI